MLAGLRTATVGGELLGGALGTVLVLWPPLSILSTHWLLVLTYFLLLPGLIETVRGDWGKTNQVAWLLFAALLAACLTGLVVLLLSADPVGDWRDFVAVYSPLLYILPLFFLFRRYSPPLALLWWGALLGAGFTGIAALAELYRALGGVSGLLSALAGAGFRVAGGSHPVIFGYEAATLALFCASGYPHFRTAKPVFLVIWAVAILLAVFACLLTGTRGAWLGMVVGFAALFAAYWSEASARFKLVVLATVVGLMLLVSRLPMVETRLAAAAQDVETYQQNANTSIGLRFEMWRAAASLAMEHPLTGVGFNRSAYRDAMADLISQGRAHPAIGRFNSAHNEFIHAIVTRGMVAATAFMSLVLLFPFLFWRACGRCDPAVRPVAGAGLMISVAYVVYGFTELPLLHSATVEPYTLLMGILLGLIYRESNASRLSRARIETTAKAVEL